MSIHFVRTVLIVASVMWAVIVVITAIDGLEADLDDYRCFYMGARAIVEDGPLYEVYQGGYIYPPLLAWVLAPVSELGEAGSAFVWTLAMAALAPLAAWLAAAAVRDALSADWTRWQTAAIAASGMIVVMEKFQRVLQQGNSDVLIALGFAAAMRWAVSRPIAAGLAIALTLNVKYLPVAFLPYLAVRRHWRALAATVVGVLLFAFLPSITLGVSKNLDYLSHAFGGLGSSIAGEQRAETAARIWPLTWHRAEGFPSALARATGQNRLAWLITLGIAGLVFVQGWALYASRGLSLFARRAITPDADRSDRLLVLLELCGLLVAVLVFSPQTIGRHFAIALPVTVVGAGLAVAHPSRLARAALWAMLGWFMLALILPPGGVVESAVQVWRDVSGAALALLCLYLYGVLWFGLDLVRRRSPAWVVS
ncbi:MAG: glycosyltransferase family 87 protein [Planctomycetota bacterium]